MDESYGTGDHISTTYNGATLSELEEHYNQIMNSLPPDQRAEFDRYLNDRRQLYLATGIDDEISGILTGIVIDLDRVCFNVWVWCWEDPFDFDFGSGGGGSGGGGGGNEDFHPTWQEEYDQLRFCEGVNDIFDTGPDNPSQLHPNYDFCAIWMAYLEDCIMPNQPEFNDFEAIGTYEELILAWAKFQYNNPELFTTIIADPADCTPTSELDDYTPEEEGEGEVVIVDAECRNALDDFLATHGITLTKAERLAILTSGGNPECTDQEAFEEWVMIAYANFMHEELTLNFPNYTNAGVNIDMYISQYGAEHYIASAILYQTFMEEVGEAPDDPYKWQLAMEVFQEELLPILLEFTPGIGDLIGAYNDFSEGNYFWGVVGIISTIVPGDEIVRVIRQADNIRDAWKKVKKIFILWNKFFTTISGQRILNNMPQSWKELPGSKLANGEGLMWRKDNFNNLRIMDANPSSPWPSQQVKYVRLVKNGQRLDKFGNPVPSTLPGGIPNPNFELDTHIPLSEITDELLDIFFP